MAHKFNPANVAKLESPERRKLLPPETTLLSLGLKSGMRLADIGCGSGFFSLPAAIIVGDNGFVYGTDIAQELVDYCTARAKATGVANTLFIKGEEAKIPLPDEEVDAVLLANIVHELLEPRKSFDEVKRILKPGGKVFLIEWKKAETPMGPPIEDRIAAVEAEVLLQSYGFVTEDYLDLGLGHYAILAHSPKCND